MKKYIFSLAVVSAIFGLALLTAQANDTPGRKIIVFSGALNQTAQDEIIARVGGTKLKNLDIIGAKSVWLPSKASEKALAHHPGILRIDDDILVSVAGKPGPAPQPSESLPWGIDQIDAELAWSTTTGSGIKVGIIDTGIDKFHPDLIDNIKGGINFVIQKGIVSPTQWNDDNGHGTHVAGTVAAVNNTIGVIGAAPQSNLYAIKVLDKRGSGYLSDVIAGIQWATANGIQVINMSLGTSSNIQSFHDAVIAAKNAGIIVVAAAGNSGGSVNYPAAYPEAIAVSAIDNAETIAYWSSRGPEVDLAAPGVSIYSTYKGSSYATLSGTSMASPHVAGAAALVLTTPISSAYDANSNGLWEPSEVQNKLQTTAKDLGGSGYDLLYGWGLVDAAAAVR
ncbi:hypothetical protein A2W39_03155 [Candidatus Azambacteria bacterium RIFCSPHIGHO2_01_46_10]|uniref:Peptidase S8/S53 domain-containing protein n=1 Tax=Candidatus Azambacteria bacterium RIFCSPHIGHO2_01_46_10 TaxID=1797293 RepID=A0A1F5BXI7_9BACT|nr:MAG: hypothetical protein A2W39_03155 [Candidatus Azambacteria bacterium RIFCSPHIGHO2_01_46_10]